MAIPVVNIRHMVMKMNNAVVAMPMCMSDAISHIVFMGMTMMLIVVPMGMVVN